VQVFGRRHDDTIHSLLRPASEKRQGTKSRAVGTDGAACAIRDRNARKQRHHLSGRPIAQRFSALVSFRTFARGSSCCDRFCNLPTTTTCLGSKIRKRQITIPFQSIESGLLRPLRPGLTSPRTINLISQVTHRESRAVADRRRDVG
jgi:hypothetical protein